MKLKQNCFETVLFQFHQTVLVDIVSDTGAKSYSADTAEADVPFL